MGSTTRSTRRTPMVSNVTGEPLRDGDGNVLYKEESSEVTTESQTLPQWTAAAWRLERRNPDRWSRVSKHQVSDKKSELLPIDAMRAILDGDDVDDDRVTDF
jgi:hypothetical protein